jgi:hypothetical protein
MNALLFADDQVVRADSEDNLRRGVFTLQNTAKQFGMEISPEKSDTMAVLGQYPIKCKIIVDNKYLQIKSF